MRTYQTDSEKSRNTAIKDAAAYAKKFQVPCGVFKNCEGTYLHRELKFIPPQVDIYCVVEPDGTVLGAGRVRSHDDPHPDPIEVF